MLNLPDVSLELARRVVAGVEAEAEAQGKAMGAAVVDRAGNLVLAIRMDGAQIVAVDLAIDKAFTAVAFGAPSDAWATSTQPGGADWGMNTTLRGRLVVFAGGLPISIAGAVIGGVGVSGSAASIDKACAQAGLDALVAFSD